MWSIAKFIWGVIRGIFLGKEAGKHHAKELDYRQDRWLNKAVRDWASDLRAENADIRVRLQAIHIELADERSYRTKLEIEMTETRAVVAECQESRIRLEIEVVELRRHQHRIENGIKFHNPKQLTGPDDKQ